MNYALNADMWSVCEEAFVESSVYPCGKVGQGQGCYYALLCLLPSCGGEVERPKASQVFGPFSDRIRYAHPIEPPLPQGRTLRNKHETISCSDTFWSSIAVPITYIGESIHIRFSVFGALLKNLEFQCYLKVGPFSRGARLPKA